MKSFKSSKSATSALNAHTSTPVARKKRPGRVAIDAKGATRATVAAHAARSKGKNTSKDNPLPAQHATPAAKPGASVSTPGATPAVKPDGKPAAKSSDGRSAKRAASKATRTGRAKLSALDAAALVLADLPKGEAATGIGAGDLIERMQSRGLWQSPGGKTPSATLYAAMLREISAKGDASRFARIAKGRFTLVAGIITPAQTDVAKPVAKSVGTPRNKGDSGSAVKPVAKADSSSAANPDANSASVTPASVKSVSVTPAKSISRTPATKSGARA